MAKLNLKKAHVKSDSVITCLQFTLLFYDYQIQEFMNSIFDHYALNIKHLRLAQF